MVWAPDAIWDEEKGQYFVHWASQLVRTFYHQTISPYPLEMRVTDQTSTPKTTQRTPATPS
jgi:hypothetical protein